MGRTTAIKALVQPTNQVPQPYRPEARFQADWGTDLQEYAPDGKNAC